MRYKNTFSLRQKNLIQDHYNMNQLGRVNDGCTEDILNIFIVDSRYKNAPCFFILFPRTLTNRVFHISMANAQIFFVSFTYFLKFKVSTSNEHTLNSTV